MSSANPSHERKKRPHPGFPGAYRDPSRRRGTVGESRCQRARGRRAIAADTDREALLAWLARFEGSPNTLASGRREAERLLLWSLIETRSTPKLRGDMVPPPCDPLESSLRKQCAQQT